MYHILSTHSSVGGYLGCFYLLAVVNNATMSAAAAKSLQSCPTLRDRIDGSPPGSPVPGILQARTLEWVATMSMGVQTSV